MEVLTQSITMSSKVGVGTRSNQRPASSEIFSLSVLLCETAVCILQVRGTCASVQRPKNAERCARGGFCESARSPARPESWNRPKLHTDEVCPTKQRCLLTTREMDVRNSSGQVFVTSFVQTGDPCHENAQTINIRRCRCEKKKQDDV